MKNKKTINPFFRLFSIVITLVVVAVITGIGLFYYIFAIPEPEGLSLASWTNIFTNNFSAWLVDETGEITVKDKGMEYLDEYTSNRIDFYQARWDKIQKIINTPSRGLSETEKEYWLDMNSKVETPLQYGYYEGWQVINSCYGLLIFSILAVCIILCPVFSGEYQAGTDAVILSAKYGKTKLTTAKIIASVLFGLIAFTLHIIVAFGIPLVAFGIDGWNLPMQIANTTIPYPFIFLQGALINLGVIYLVLLAMISLTLFRCFFRRMEQRDYII